MSALGQSRCSLGNNADAQLPVSTLNLILCTLNRYKHDDERA